MTAAAGALLAALLAFAAFGGTVATTLCVALVQVVLVAGWVGAARVPEPLLGGGLALASGLAVDLLVLGRDEPRPLVPVTLVLGPAVVAAFLHQLVRRHPRTGTTASLTATVTLLTVVVLAALHLAARGTRGGAPLVAAVAVGAIAAILATLVPVPGRWAAPAGPVRSSSSGAPNEVLLRTFGAALVGAGAGALVGTLGDLGTSHGAAHGALLGATGAVAAAVGRVLAEDATADGPGRDPVPRPDLAPLVVAALPIALTGPVSYVLGRILVG